MSDDLGAQDIGGSRRARRQAEAASQQAPVEQVPGVTADAAGGAPPRPKRVRKPFGNMDQKLNYPERKGYHRHWFNDVPGRLQRAEEAGYEQVMAPDGKPVQMVVGVGRGGNALTAYLHEIPLEDYQEDMAAQDSAVHERLGQIERGMFERPSGRDGQLQYAGSERGEIRITSGHRR